MSTSHTIFASAAALSFLVAPTLAYADADDIGTTPAAGAPVAVPPKAAGPRDATPATPPPATPHRATP